MVKLYTWPDSVSPSIAQLSLNDDYVYMKQDDTRFSNTNVMTFTNTYYATHDLIEIPHENYVDEFEPSHTYTGTESRAPIMFKFKVMTPFQDLTGTNQYHQINLKYGDYYEHPDYARNTNDLHYDVNICELNGDRIQDCSFDNTWASMKFQQQLNVGDEASVLFTILYPQQR